MSQIHFLLTFILISISTVALAKSDTKSQVDRLESNSKNSEQNLEQYERNLATVEKNIAEVDKALANLKTQLEDVKVTEGDMKKNKEELDKAKAKYENLISKENEDIKKDQVAIDQLQKALHDAEERQRKRNEHILAYQKKIQEIEQEKGDWDQHTQMVGQLQKGILQKEASAQSEKKKWADKKQAYLVEVKKWKSQARNAKETYLKYKHLND